MRKLILPVEKYKRRVIPIEASSNKLGEMPIGRLLISMSVPMMISMFIQALYNVVDSMFVAKISEEALAAVGIAFPMQNIASAIGVGTGVGIAALVPRSLGSGDRKTAEKAANVQNFLCICYSLLFVVIGLAFSETYYNVQTNDPAIIDAGVKYMRIVCAVSLGVFFGQGLEKLLMATGYSALSMVCQASGAVINIVLDPILIFGLGPIPAMGVSGAAWATVIGQIIGALLALIFNLKKNKVIHFSLKEMLPNRKILGEIFSVGIPSMLTVGLASVMSYCINQIFLAVGTTATAVFGIWIKLQSFGFMPVYGLNNGSIAIFAYNRGAKRYDRVRKTLKLALITGIAVSLLVMLFYIVAARPLLALFSASENMYAIGSTAIRICALSLPFGAYNVVISSSFQSLGKPRDTFIVNMCRQLIILVPVAWLLSLTGDIRLIWGAFPIADIITLFISLVMGRRTMKAYAE